MKATYITLQEAIVLLGVKRRTIYAYIKKYNIGKIGKGSTMRLLKADVDKLVKTKGHADITARVLLLEKQIIALQKLAHTPMLSLTNAEGARLTSLLITPPSNIDKLLKLIRIIQKLDVDNIVFLTELSKGAPAWIILSESIYKIEKIILTVKDRATQLLLLTQLDLAAIAVKQTLYNYHIKYSPELADQYKLIDPYSYLSILK